ncbi:HNH endonuclease [Candidatus Woesearchaeota archaeon]|nr:HNH endonuclease [Candidatus Woesearchaeota archaeon]
MSEQKLHLQSIIGGLIALVIFIAIIYFTLITFFPGFQLIFTIILIALGIGLLVVAYFSIKDVEFRHKTAKFFRNLLFFIDALGQDVAKESAKSSAKKKRVPLTAKQKAAVYDLAGDKCQLCGKKGNLKIHHIDSNPSNNRATNLILLCGNDHDDADRGAIPKFRLIEARKKQKTAGYVSVSKPKK